MAQKSARHLVLAGLIAVAVVGCAAGVQLAKDGIAHPGQVLFNGHANAEVDCFRCHNGNGRGSGRGPDLAPEVAKLPDAAILEIIAKGAAFMPAYGDRTSEEERRQILGWLREAFGGPAEAEAPEVDAEEVE